MKRFKRLFSLLAAAMMVLAMGIPASAADNEFTITAPANDHTYEIYQIFTGNFATEGENGYLSNVKWGQNGTGEVGEDVDPGTLNTLASLNGKSDTEKLTVISQYANLEGEVFQTVRNSGTVAVPGGYYLIKDVDDSLDGETDESYTLYIVEVAGDITITPKSDVPTLTKKVKDINDSTETRATDWQDSADHDIGDTIDFMLTGTVAENYDDYGVYQFIFHDTQSKGLSFDSESVVVRVDGVAINRGYQVVTEGLQDGCTFEVRFANLKDIPEVEAGSDITVEYKSTLNDGAKIGSAGNPNVAELEYSNNPNDKQGGETGTTVEDTVIVFTYKTEVNKVDEESQPLTGAAFQLDKKLQDGSLKTVKTFTVDEQNPISTFEFTGLDDGNYILTETVTPDTYNTIDPIEFTVTAEHEITSDNPQLTSLSGSVATGQITFTPNVNDGSLTTNVVNSKGTILPETGGIGTIIFYVVGGVLMVGAAALFITRRRAQK